MRRAVFLCLGLFELAVAGVLLAIGLLLPTPASVRETFGRAGRVTASAHKQVNLLSDELGAVGGLRVQRLAREIEPELPRTLGSLASGMEAWAGALDPELVSQFHDSVTRLASFLDESVAPAAGRSAERLEKTTAALRKDSRSLVNADRVKALREGFKGLETALSSGADQVAKLASYTYPVVKIRGIKAIVDEKPFWPEGERVADGMRKGAKALKAAGTELDSQLVDLPKLQKAYGDSRKELLATTTDLVKVLREAERLKDVAKALRSKQQNIEKAAKTWPALRKNLLESAGRVRELQGRLDRLIEDAATRARFARINTQRHGLEELGDSLGEMQGTLPEMANTAANITLLLRGLLALLAFLVAVHACYQLTRGRWPRPVAA